MRMSKWIVAAAVLWTAGGVLPLWEQAPRPAAPEVIETRELPSYAGRYKLRYTGLNGRIEVCLTRNEARTCASVQIDVPLTPGRSAVEGVAELMRTLEGRVSSPELLDRVRERLEGLPHELELHAVGGKSLLVASLEIEGEPAMVPGEIVPQSGQFTLLNEVMIGRIDADRQFAGGALVQVPLHLWQSTPATGGAPVSIQIDGVLEAAARLSRQELPPAQQATDS